MDNKFWSDEILRLYFETRSLTKAKQIVHEMMKEQLEKENFLKELKKMQINELVKMAHENAKNKGFWEDSKFIKMVTNEANKTNDEKVIEAAISMNNNAICTRLMLIVGEVAEAQEGLRKENIENFREELADIVIRVADLAGGLNIDLENEIIQKMYKNKQRPYKHGKAF